MINLSNALAQLFKPQEKIFFVGFNKCGTTSFHHFFEKNGIRSIHCEHRGDRLALRISQRLYDDKALKRYLYGWTVFSDMSFNTSYAMVDANRNFVKFHELYPDAFFILNDRNADGWISSRKRHHKGRLLEQAKAFYCCDEEEVERIWRRQYQSHINDVKSYFADKARFLHFNLETHSIENLVDFLSPTYDLDTHHWQQKNLTRS